jgi:hypothetical protein
MARASVGRTLIMRNTEAGIMVAGDGATLVLADVAVLDTRATPGDGSSGRGLQVQEGPHVSGARLLFCRNREIAVQAYGSGTLVELEDVTACDTASRESDGFLGRGVQVLEGAHLTAARVVFERNLEVSAYVAGEGAELALSDAVVRGTGPRDCSLDGRCAAEFGAGTGVGAYGGGHADVRRFLITGNTMCGVQLAYARDEEGIRYPVGGTMDLHDGEVSHNTVCGANVQTEGFDVNRLTDNVWYHDNAGMNLATDELVVPDGADGIVDPEPPP